MKSPEDRFLLWLSYHESVAKSLPVEILSPNGVKQLESITSGDTRIRQLGDQPPDEEAEAYFQKQTLAVLGKEAAKAQRKGDIKNVEKLLDAYKRGLRNGHNLIVEYASTQPAVREFIPTGIVPLDEQIKGLAKGELGIIAAPPGRGKSLAMIQMSGAALIAGRSVLYITVADADKNELIPRLDTCILGDPQPESGTEQQLQHRHSDAIKKCRGRLWIADFTEDECSIENIEQVIGDCDSDIVIVDHADDVLSSWSADPTVTRHSLRLTYTSLKKASVKYQVPIFTASQTPEHSWFFDTAGINELSESKVGKATSAAIILVLTGGRPEMPGVMNCTIAKARRTITERVIKLRYAYEIMRIW